jgi:hypothetical protein
VGVAAVAKRQGEIAGPIRTPLFGWAAAGGTADPQRVSSFVAITCGDCGTAGEAGLGEDWWCDGCGVTWHVDPDPAAVAGLDQINERHSRAMWGSLAVVVAVCALVALVGDRGAAMFAIPAAVALWLLAVRPHLRRRRRQAVERVEAWTVSRAPTQALP